MFSIIDSQKPIINDLDYFKVQRPELYKYILNKVFLVNNKRFKVVNAPVKSGKREMVEIYSLLNIDNHNCFLSAHYRIADDSQRKELESYGINIFSANKTDNIDRCMYVIDEFLKTHKDIHIHLDELDFGCGSNQLLNNVYSKYKSNNRVFFILYSATTEVAKKEFLLENVANDIIYECCQYCPPPTYFGIKQYLQNDKFFQATPFFHFNNETSIKISEQGEMLINKLKEDTFNITNKKHIGILRLPGMFKNSLGKSQPQFNTIKKFQSQLEAKYEIRLKFIGSDDEIAKWDDIKYWEELSPNIIFLIIINQVAGRSTAWKCHPYLSWYHTCRTCDTPTSTIIQDQERPVYYTNTPDYNNQVFDIEIYGDKPTAEYSAKIIGYEQYNKMTNRKLNSRLNQNNGTKHIKCKPVQIFNSWEAIPSSLIGGRRKETYICEKLKLKQNMNIDDKIYNISTEIWEKYMHLEGFIMTNIRSSRGNFLNGIKSKNSRPIWFKTDIDKELSEGLNEHTKIRFNIFYDDEETNPNNYKIMVREFDKYVDAEVTNTSMYNI